MPHYKNKILPVFLFFAVLASVSAAGDRFASFAALSAASKEGIDYKKSVFARSSPVTVFVIHGGTLEPGTKEAGAACAGQDWNLYVFEVLSSSNPGRFHITATRFDDPAAVALATASVVAIAFHGERDKGSAACVGGGNAVLRRRVARELESGGFSVEQPCRRLPGASPDNIVNKSAEKGVQLELSEGMSKSLESDAKKREAFCSALRRAVHGYLAGSGTVH